MIKATYSIHILILLLISHGLANSPDALPPLESSSSGSSSASQAGPYICQLLGQCAKSPPQQIFFNEKQMTISDTNRTSISILKVLKLRSPGLRHLIRKSVHSRKNQKGIISFDFTIDFSGKIIDIQILSSTTSNSYFDQKVLRKIERWRFPSIDSGVTRVLIPLVFK